MMPVHRAAALSLLTAFSLLAAAGTPANPPPPRFTPEMEAFVRDFKPGGQDFAGKVTPLSPEESVKRMRPAAGYAVEAALAEPHVRQPIDIRFDERGRLWVVQYLQYPFPAGITVTSYDQYLRAEFDRMPPPPPNHVRGADKITIHEDRDGDGKYETHKTFVDGLNMATSFAFGNGGVWVLQSPYLLFYPDRDGDDVPDGAPEVHLAGFGLEDTHSLASSLHVGPDGWVYGATGSTTNLDIQGVRLLGQGIWRYHPGTKVFEVFAEGGGNTFSFEFDQFGRAYSGTNNGATRGLHYAPGATYVKNWTKHGPAMNPFLFGFFEHMAHQGYSQRFPQTFLFYEGGLFPELEGQIVVGMSLTNRVQASRVHRDTSTFRTVDSVTLIDSEDRTFRPVDIEQGPDGAIYVADWTDVRLSHLNPQDTWDKSNGRIFRIVPAGFARPAAVDLRRESTSALMGRLADPNRWFREQARRLLVTRPEQIADELIALLQKDGPSALEALWLLHVRGELPAATLRSALRHPNGHVRRWAVRLLGDAGTARADTQRELVALAAREPDIEVRSQLASTAKRLPAAQAFPIIRQLLNHDADAADKHIPLLLWWAIEARADSGREEILALIRDPAVWSTKLFATHLAPRIAMRYTADQGPRRYYKLKQGVYSDWIVDRAPEHLARNLQMCARLLETAPTPGNADALIAGMARGLTGRPVDVVPARMRETITPLWSSRPHSVPLITLAARLGVRGAMSEAIALVKAGKLKDADQQQCIDLLASSGSLEAVPLVGDLVRHEKNEARRSKWVAALGGFEQVAAADVLFEVYPTLSPRLKVVAQRMLSEKPAWAQAMLHRMNQGTFDPGVLSSINVAAIRGHNDPRITSLLVSYQQKRADDPAQQLAQQLFDAGKVAYNLSCAPCHEENGEGKIGLAPSLVGSPWLGRGEEFLVRILLHGKVNPGRGFVMPPWRHLEDGQLAAILTYVRREFGNQTATVAPAKIAEIRAATSERLAPWTDEELKRLPVPAGQ